MLRCLGIIAVLTLLSLAACDERSSLPTAPFIQSPATGPWRTLQPQHPAVSVRCLFALDNDDVWAGHNEGYLRHWNGDQVRWHRLPQNASLVDIHGCHRDEVWALAGDMLWRWDGREWIIGPHADPNNDTYVDCLWNDTPGEVYLGGRSAVSRRGYVAHLTDSGWKHAVIGQSESKVCDIWRPHDDGPLLAQVESVVANEVYIQTDDGWEPLVTNGPVHTATGSLLVSDSSTTPFQEALHRIGRDNQLFLECDAVNISGDLLDFGAPLVVGWDVITEIRGCQPYLSYERTLANRWPLEIPRRPNQNPTVIYGVTDDEGVCRITRGTSDWFEEDLVMPDWGVHIREDLVISDGQVFGRCFDDLVVGAITDDPDDWRQAGEGEFDVFWLGPAQGGGLLAVGRIADSGENRVGWRAPDGTWDWTPPVEVSWNPWLWRDPGTGDIQLMNYDAEFMVYRDGQWHTLDSLGRNCSGYTAGDIDRQYALVSLEDWTQRLVHYDGTAWRDITDDDMGQISSMIFSVHRDALLVETWIYDEELQRNRRELWQLRDDQWQIQALDQDINLWGAKEDSDGRIYFGEYRQIRILHDEGVKIVFDSNTDPDFPGDRFRDFWFDEQSGLFVLDENYQLHHRPLDR